MIRPLLLSLLIAGPAFAAEPQDYTVKVLRVIDGDTFDFIPPGMWLAFVPPRARVSGLDTPESRKPPAKKVCEVALGHKATDYAKTLLHPGDTVTIHWDGKTKEKYGRLLGTVRLADGRDFGEAMIEAGHARPYDGGRKSSWC